MVPHAHNRRRLKEGDFVITFFKRYFAPLFDWVFWVFMIFFFLLSMIFPEYRQEIIWWMMISAMPVALLRNKQ
jgi:hypothetical protein